MSSWRDFSNALAGGLRRNLKERRQDKRDEARSERDFKVDLERDLKRKRAMRQSASDYEIETISRKKEIAEKNNMQPIGKRITGHGNVDIGYGTSADKEKIKRKEEEDRLDLELKRSRVEVNRAKSDKTREELSESVEFKKTHSGLDEDEYSSETKIVHKMADLAYQRGLGEFQVGQLINQRGLSERAARRVFARMKAMGTKPKSAKDEFKEKIKRRRSITTSVKG